MRSKPSTTTERTSRVHQAALYDSDEEFRTIVAAFVREGLDAGEPAIAAVNPHQADLLRRAVPATSQLTLLNPALHYARPAETIKFYRRLLREHIARGAPRIRLIGQLPEPGTALPWNSWARYEAALNRVFDDLPVRILCTYDRRTTPEHVLADVERTHPWLSVRAGEHRANPLFEDPAVLCAPRLVDRDALARDLGPPTAALTRPAPGSARELTVRTADAAGLDSHHADGLVLAVSELVSNALRHGHPPVTLRLWHTPESVTVAVTDSGGGPEDPFAGLVPARRNPADGGLGLWLVHQMCDHVTMQRHTDGFTIAATVTARRAGRES